ncbi:MAG: hypothetical protein CVU44_20845 [Chloroflexi bacterium HGW-Chloroflexi-6]|nr:MAG: hypothetical protein CVU44_20845 [Chloroflexi bacterium HGW-Chloroflexi-6]
MSIRYAIWCAVSSERQAGDDKISLPDQEARCRSVANAKGWQETSLPYIVPGETRTAYINLRDAEDAIPELRQMLFDAERDRFDVLVMYDYNRMRELLDPVARTLAAYKVQIYSVTQQVEPQTPETFNIYRADSAWMMQYLSSIISRAQVYDLRRKYEIGMPARVQNRGLPAISIPFGYRKPPGKEKDSSAIPVQDKVTSLIVTKFKDLLLQGRSLRQLVDFANGTGIKSPKGKAWSSQTIRDILRNPFYAGYNRWGMSKNFTDPRTGKSIRNRHVNPDNVIVERGYHIPLWDEETHQRIIRDLDERGNAYRGKSASQLSRLLICAKCGSPLWMQHNGPRSEPDRAIWRCSKPGCGAANILHSLAIEQAGLYLQDEITRINDPRKTTNADKPSNTLEEESLKELLKRRSRIVDIFESGGLTKDEYMVRRRELDTQIGKVEQEIEDLKQKTARSAERKETLMKFERLVGGISEWITNEDPIAVNSALRVLLATFIVDGDKIVHINFKE